MVAEGITIKYSMINMDKIHDAPTAIAPTDIIYGTQISNVLKGEILQASLYRYIYIYILRTTTTFIILRDMFRKINLSLSTNVTIISF